MNHSKRLIKAVQIMQKRKEKEERRKQKEERKQNLMFAKYLLKLSKK